MATINKLFSNALANMNREELIQYLSNELTNTQIRNILKKIPEHKKTEILEARLKAIAESIFTSMANISAKITELNKEEQRNIDLQKLKGRILLCRLIQKLAINSGDEKLLVEANNNLSAVFTEYKMLGGTEAFHTTDSSASEILTEEFLLNKYWTPEVQATYKKMGNTSFTKWNIPAEEAKSFLGKGKFKLLEESEEKKRFYFFKDFYISKLCRSGSFIFGIGFDSERKANAPILYKVQGGRIKK